MVEQSQVVRDFLLRLSEQRDLLEQYRRAPERVMKDNGLTEESIETLQSGSIQRIRVLLAGPGNEKAMMNIHVILIYPHGGG